MRQAVWTADALTVSDAEPPALAPGWARLRVEACGICGSDLHFWHDPASRPLGSAPGHEFVGTLVDGPAGLADARYAASPAVACGTCEYCVTGAPQLCGRGGPGIGLGRNGALADYVDVPVANLFAVDDRVDAQVASMSEPLAVAVRGVDMAEPAPGSRVMVLGAGTVGLLTALVAQAAARQVVITARYPHQRAAAERMGLTVLDEADAAAWGKDNRPDIVIETVGGNADTLELATRVARRGGRIVVIGSFNRVSLDFGKILLKELEIFTSFAYGTSRRGSQFGTAVELLPQWRDELAGIQTHAFTLDQVAEAFVTASDKQSGALKVTVLP